MATTSEFKSASGALHLEKYNPEATHTKDVEDQDMVDLNRNLSARIENPIANIPRLELLRQVGEFAKEANMVPNIPALCKGALVAQNPSGFESLEDLDEEERMTLRNEAQYRWRQPRALYFTIVVYSIGARVQGWDQTGANGANLSFPYALGIAAAIGEPNYERDAWIVGLVNAGPNIASCLLGCWLSDPINNWTGRRGATFFSAVFCLFPVLCQGFCQTWPQLLVCRLLLGIGMGCKAATIPVYAAENSPKSIRGALTMTWQMWTAFGVALGCAANLALYRAGPIAWRLQLASAFLPAVPLALLVYFCPESPRWYMKKKRYEDAYRSLCRLRMSEIQASRDLYSIHVQLSVEGQAIGKRRNCITRFFELFTVPRNRRAAYAAFTVMIAQQMCGSRRCSFRFGWPFTKLIVTVNIIAYYSSTVFVRAGATVEGALLASFGFGLVVFVFAFPAFKYIDTFGRRSLLLLTFPQMAWTLLAAGLCVLIPQDNKAHLVLIAFFVYLFAAFYAGGEGPVPYAYSAEVFPLSHREVGMAFATATTYFWSAVLSMTFPRLLAALGTTGTFGLYTGFNVVALVMIFFLVPETMKKSLEQLEYVLATPTSIHVHYQLTQALPCGIQRYLLFNRKVQLRPLYEE